MNKLYVKKYIKNSIMPIYYHIHRSMKKSPIENNFKEGKMLFFSKKNSFWHNFEKDVGLDWGGYSEYKITIPQKYFTYSLNPRKKNKILKLTPKNIKGFIKLHENKYNGPKLRDGYINKNFIGIDATNKKLRDLYRVLKYNPDGQLDPPAGWITQKFKDITIQKVKVVKSD